jgi:Flp pilus assembly CpaF family ATPase
VTGFSREIKTATYPQVATVDAMKTRFDRAERHLESSKWRGSTSTSSSHFRLVRKLREAVGDVICAALVYDDVVEIMLNPDGQLFVERLGEPAADEGSDRRSGRSRRLHRTNMFDPMV